jgi:hypothetical protein
VQGIGAGFVLTGFILKNIEPKTAKQSGKKL